MASSYQQRRQELGPGWTWIWRDNRIRPFAPPETDGPVRAFSDSVLDEQDQIPVKHDDMKPVIQK